MSPHRKNGRGEGRKKNVVAKKTEVECEKCEKWVDLEETQFKCEECNKTEQETGRPTEEEMRREWEMLRSMIEELRVQITEERLERTAAENRMTAKLEDERTQRVVAETRLMEVLNTEMKERRNTRGDTDSIGSVQAAVDRRDDGNGPLQRDGEEVKARRESGTENGARKKKSNNKSRESVNRGQLMPRERQENTNTPEMGRIETEQPKRSGSEANAADKRETWEASHTSDRRVLVVGDTGAYKMKRKVLKAVDYDKRVYFATKPGAQLKETMARAERDHRIWQAGTGMVVIHAGSMDMRGEVTAQSAINELEEQLKRWVQMSPEHQYVVCAVPVESSVGPTKEKSIQMNTLTKEMTQRLGPRVEFVDVNIPAGEDQGDTHNGEGAEEMGRSLGIKIEAFLGSMPVNKGMASQTRTQGRNIRKQGWHHRLQKIEEQLQRMHQQQGRQY